jgi:hypothetical protein
MIGNENAENGPRPLRILVQTVSSEIVVLFRAVEVLDQGGGGADLI